MSFATYASAAFIGGMLVAAQGPIYARLAAGLDHNRLLAVFLAFASAALITGLATLLTGGMTELTLGSLRSLPAWVWLGGLFGAVHVAISMQTIPRVGATVFLVIVVAGNLAGAALYDHLGAIGLDQRVFTVERGAGLTLVILGVTIVAMAE